MAYSNSPNKQENNAWHEEFNGRRSPVNDTGSNGNPMALGPLDEAGRVTNVPEEDDTTTGIANGITISSTTDGEGVVTQSADIADLSANGDAWPDWLAGSANFSVIQTWMANGGSFKEASHQTDFENYTFNESLLYSYIYPKLCYGYEGDAFNRDPGDLMSIRGYPTPYIDGEDSANLVDRQDSFPDIAGSNGVISAINQYWKVIGYTYPFGQTTPILTLTFLFRISNSIVLPYDQRWRAYVNMAYASGGSTTVDYAATADFTIAAFDNRPTTVQNITTTQATKRPAYQDGPPAAPDWDDLQSNDATAIGNIGPANPDRYLVFSNDISQVAGLGLQSEGGRQVSPNGNENTLLPDIVITSSATCLSSGPANFSSALNGTSAVKAMTLPTVTVPQSVYYPKPPAPSYIIGTFIGMSTNVGSDTRYQFQIQMTGVNKGNSNNYDQANRPWLDPVGPPGGGVYPTQMTNGYPGGFDGVETEGWVVSINNESNTPLVGRVNGVGSQTVPYPIERIYIDGAPSSFTFAVDYIPDSQDEDNDYYVYIQAANGGGAVVSDMISIGINLGTG